MNERAATAAVSIDRSYELADRYRKEEGRVFLTGVQALVRLPLLQARADRAAGLTTSGFISGYRGSPLGGYDLELGRAKKTLDAHDVVFEPGLNEDLAATAVWGTQQLAHFGKAKVQGVHGYWYGKGPGVDRTADVFRHANMFGTSKHGGVLAFAGDDHAAASSVIPHQTDFLFKTCSIPTIYPATVSEYLDFGLAGLALSRFSGLWVAFKCATETVESASVVQLPTPLPHFATPDDFELPPHGLNYDPTLPALAGRMEQERRLYEERLPAARAFWRLNGFDGPVLGAERPRFALISAGKGHAELLEALRLLGIDDAEAKRIGLGVYRVGMTWPLDWEPVADYVAGAEIALVVEEKRANVEAQVKDGLYNRPAPQRPLVLGKRDENEEPLISPLGQIHPDDVIKGMLRAFEDRLGEEGARWRRIYEERMAAKRAAPTGAGLIPRKAFFCAGCPHNTSTNVPDGSIAGGGIGCHILALGSRNTEIVCQMGGEGVFWVGAQHFVETPHTFQNLGDGTYQHSGVLAVRQAVAAKANITFKILFNDAVAMTGGQTAEGPLSPDRIARQLAAEGVVDIRVVSDHPEHHSLAQLPAGAKIHHRDDLDEVQRDLREIPGVTAIIYEQTCATEKRRRRKRGLMDDPKTRIFINDRICEGCGDCSVKSNCIAVEPHETEFGVKRRVNQSSCNKDFSCVKGFCPSFVAVETDGIAKPDTSMVEAAAGDLLAGLPQPELPAADTPFNILVTGIGGTGVVTIGQLLAMAAHLEGRGSMVLDHTGLAQKGGSVISHVRVAQSMDELKCSAIVDGEADLLLACDMLTAAADDATAKIARGRTTAVINTIEAPTSDFVKDSVRFDFPTEAAIARIRRATGENDTTLFEATSYAEALLGDAIGANLMMLGYAWQQGRIPLSFEAIDRAIELNGVAIAMNREAFAWGRLSAVEPETVAKLVADARSGDDEIAETLEEIQVKRERELTDYQNAAYADRYRALVEKAVEAETRVSGAAGPLAEAVARYYYKLLAYKDEYEVARLYSDPAYLRKLEKQFAGVGKLQVYLAPPLLSPRDPETGELQKRKFGPWIFTAFDILKRFKFLRGGAFDIFGKTEERRMERALIAEYEADIERILGALTGDRLAAAVAIASAPDMIRGFGHVKERNVKAYREGRDARWRAFDEGRRPTAPSGEQQAA